MYLCVCETNITLNNTIWQGFVWLWMFQKNLNSNENKKEISCDCCSKKCSWIVRRERMEKRAIQLQFEIKKKKERKTKSFQILFAYC